MRGVLTLYVDQYGNRFYARTLRALREQVPGKVSKMFVDGVDNKVYHTGYVIGQHWLTAYQPIRIPA